MKKYALSCFVLALVLCVCTATSKGETSFPDSAYKVVSTYINPIIPSDFPDITLFKNGHDFYACGSSFHYTPYCAVYHSTDLVHWEIISRAVQPTWSGIISDSPGAGMWEGAITRFYDSWWLYFSNTAGGGQYFTKASSPYGPWSTPIKVKTTATTGTIGYDNSIFVDDDGTPYMLIKNGKYINKIQQIGYDGHLTGDAIDLAWVNNDGKYSWAEGPVMCKRDGWFYYFIAGNVGGGQWVLRTQNLHADSTKWQELGKFFADVTDANMLLRAPNHVSQPIQIADGTWWCLSHSYENYSGNDWGGKGRQCLLHQVTWDGKGKPTGMAPTSTAATAPNLPSTGIATTLPRSDTFSSTALALPWYFLNKQVARNYSLSARKGWLRLTPGSDSTHLLQKDAAHYSTLLTCVDVNTTAEGEEAGLYVTNGKQSVTVELVSCYDNGKKIVFRFGSTVFKVQNNIGNILWLKMIRKEHQLEGLYSADNITWNSLGIIDATPLDKSQDNYNSWVGNSNGLYAKKITADFDCYTYKDGFTEQPAISFSNAFGTTIVSRGYGKAVCNKSDKGGWLMLGGMDLGTEEKQANNIQLAASSSAEGNIEIWLDDIERNGQKIATINIPAGKPNVLSTYTASTIPSQGQHDVYLRFSAPAGTIFINSVKFSSDNNATNTKSIKESNDMPSRYTVYDCVGHALEEGQYNKGATIGTQLNPGAYILKLTSSTLNKEYKIIKRK